MTAQEHSAGHRPTVLFAPTTDAHVAIFASVLGALQAAGRVETLVLSLEGYAGSGAACNPLLSLASEVVRAPQPFSSPLPLAQMSFGRRSWARLRFRLYLAELFARRSPALVVVGNDFCPLEYALTRYAGQVGVPTLLVQDGILSWTPAPEADERMRIRPITPARAVARIGQWLAGAAGLDLAPPVELAYGTGGCTRIAISGDATREVLRARGVPDEAMVTTGQPRYDALIHSRPNRESARARLGIPPEQRLVLLVGQGIVAVVGGREEGDRIYDAVLTGLLRLPPRLTVVVRPHPRDDTDPSHYGTQIRRLGQRLGVPEGDLPRVAGDEVLGAWDMLVACDVAISFTSTLLLEALILGKPIVTLDLLPRARPHPFATAGPIITSADGIPGAIEAALARPQPEAAARVLRAELHALDGASGRRVARLIEDMVGEGDAARPRGR